jgi:hypothetical protein
VQPLKQTISLAQRYAFAFENQLRKTGAMNFQTTLDDFDSYYPGAYAGRITEVEVEVDGLVPPLGISGSLTNSGVSLYRLPFVAWPDPQTPAVKYRVQPRETLVLSDYQKRADLALLPPDNRQRAIFDGAGVASTWRLELPKAINDIDYGALLDVRLTFYYEARFDPAIAAAVSSTLASRPGFLSRQRAIPLRWIYPDAFFAFQRDGHLTFRLGPRDFRNNETQPALNAVGILVAMDDTVAPGGHQVELTTPGAAAAVADTLDATGLADSGTVGSPWGPLAQGPAIGEYTVALPGLDREHAQNIVLLLDYTFVPRT